MSDLYTRTETVEAHQWLPTDPLTAGRTLGWLLSLGVEITHGSGPEATLTITHGEALTAHPGQWIVHHPEQGYSVIDQADFENAYAPIGPVRTRRRGVTNLINGSATGTIIQTGDCHGDIRL